jgi:phosphatidate cytidylyltransferase
VNVFDGAEELRSMTWKRVATAAVLIPFAVGVVLKGSTGVLAIVVALIMLLALGEYFTLGAEIGQRAYRYWTATCAAILVYVQWQIAEGPRAFNANIEAIDFSFARFLGGLPEVQDVFFLFVLGVAAITLFMKRPLVETLPAAGISASGLLLVAFPLTYAIRLHGIGPQGSLLLLFALVITWVADSAAYFAGRALGKHPLAPHLSPKKTWEGSIAGFVGSLLVAVVFARWIVAPLPHLLAMAAVGNIAGQAGDLLESAYKRSAGIKDSGSLLPGHGGVLDRIDALILAIPVVWYYWVMVYSPRS